MDYRLEWKKSCVDEELIDLNVTPLEGMNSLDYLLYSEHLQRNNDGRVSSQILKRYQHTTEGGWWCSGEDVLTGKDDLWGCFKPVNPRLSADNKKIIKYEHPPGEGTGVFTLRVPPMLWEKIAKKTGIDILQQKQTDFWSWVIANPEIPLLITEGAKKAGTLLSAGYAAIALPGVNNGYRTPKDENGKKIGKSHLIPQLEILGRGEREIYIVFDQDKRPKSVKAVNAAIRKMGSLLSQANCKVKVVTWSADLGKGVDDLIALNGQSVFENAYQKAVTFEIWKTHTLNQLTYNVDLVVNEAFISSLDIPADAQLVAIRSPQGSGKTEFLSKVVQNAIIQERPVLVIGHRIKLVEELCQRFGIEYISQAKEKLDSRSYGLCIDSLHPLSQAQFNPHDWSNALIILDEVEQVIWHGLNSSTCSSNRVSILGALKQLMQNALGGNGRVYIADADLSDVSIDYLISLSEVEIEPYVVENQWLPEPTQTYPVYYYKESTPKRLVKDLIKELQSGGKAFVCLSAQQLKSQWGTQTLESYFHQQFGNLRILRIDSESLCEQNHPAYNCLNNLNEILLNYDLVLASPSIETGVSIDIKGHFTSVWSIAQGVQTTTSVCQALGRVREHIPRYVWAASYGFNKIGNGATSLAGLLSSGERLTQLNIRMLQQSDFNNWDMLNTKFQAESLLCWAKMAIRVNGSMLSYRENILNHLNSSGHTTKESRLKKIKVTEEKNISSQSLTEVIKAVQEENYLEDCQAVVKTPLLSSEDYKKLKRNPLKTPQDRQSLKKYSLKQRYGVPVTVKLVNLDDKGWYKKIRLHYFLTLGRPYLSDRDALVAQKMLQQGDGKIFLPDFNGSQMAATIGVLEILGIPALLGNLNRELSNQDTDLESLALLAMDHRQEIRTVTGINIPKTASPMLILRQVLSAIGYGLDYICCRGSGRNRLRIYQICDPQDGRQKVFSQWLRRDMASPGSSEPDLLDESSNLGVSSISNELSVQLELNI